MKAGNNRGSIYASVMVIAFTLGLAVTGVALFSQTRTKHSTVAVAKRVAQSTGEAACEGAANILLQAMADFDYANIPTTGSGPIPVDITVGSDVIPCTLAAANVDQVVETDASGIQTIVVQYEITANATSTEGTLEAIRTIYEITATPIFQFAVFYGDDLEMLPGPTMTLSGRIHSNADMYIGTNNGAPGFIMDTNYVRAAGGMYRQRKDDGSVPAGNVYADDGTGSSVNWGAGMDSDSATWYDDALNTWDGVVQSDVHGVTTLAVPSVGSIAPGGHYDTKAAEGGVQIYDNVIYVDGVDVTAAFNAAAGGTIVSSSTVYDRRENQTNQVYNVDVSRLNTAINSYFGSGAHPENFNGVLYMHNSATAVGNPDGFQLSNADLLIQGSGGNAVGLTTVTDGPIYINGDFNDGDAGNGVANTSNKKPAAVIADAVNLLSNSWNNSKVAGGSLPAASNTNYYFAMISGNVETPDGGGQYSGGLENLPRFHENWSGRTAFFRGSFVCLGESQYATGGWVYGGNYYTAPNRNWNYDTDFNNVNNLPPECPMAWGVRRVLFTGGGDN